MRRLVLVLCTILLAGCNLKIKYPYVQEYVAGQGNIKGNVSVEKFTSVSDDFAIGANEDGYAVFKDPDKAFDRLLELYSKGIHLIQTSFHLKPLSKTNYKSYGKYGWQVTTGTKEEREQAYFVSAFMDIYENSFSNK
ncbi:MAG: hypothetical protein E7192_07025 [Erysipelotrichaceae bacterium]|nr:hypothetical protein [Erysipelotrichaceae bacterium]